MNLLDGIATRATAAKLTGPAATREHVEQMLRAAVRAPDHGRLRPWRFVVLEGAARVRLGAAMADALLKKIPDATPDQLDNERRKALRAPTIVVAAAQITKGKIPEIERVEAVAAAAQNILLAAHALGYGAMWKTGGAAYDPQIKTMLGLSPGDHIVAMIYVGSIAAPGSVSSASIDGLVRWMQ